MIKAISTIETKPTIINNTNVFHINKDMENDKFVPSFKSRNSSKNSFFKKIQNALYGTNIETIKPYSTKEPTDDAFGIYVRENEHYIRGLAYAYLISANTFPTANIKNLR